MIDLQTLRLITQNGLKNFAAGRILDGIAALRTLIPYCERETILRAEAESLEENYHHMLSFLRQGGDDERRGDVLNKIQRQGIVLLEQASRAIHLSLNNDLYSKALKTISLKEDILETDERQDDIFDMLWTSPIWTAQDTALWYDFLLRQRDMVQQHLAGAVFLALWEHYDAEKMQLLGILADSECHRTHITAASYLLLLRLRHNALASLLPPLPDCLLSAKNQGLVAKVQYEMLLMLVSEKDLEKELKEAENLTKNVLANISPAPAKGESDEPDLFLPSSEAEGKNLVKSLKEIVSLRGRYLRNRLQRGLDINLSKIPLLHSCEYLHRISHWFLPFDKTHPLFQTVMIDEKGKEKQNLSTLVDLILDCDIDKMAMLYLVANDKDFSKAIQRLDDQELPEMEDAIIPEYTVRFIMQDLYRFFTHSPLHSQFLKQNSATANPFRTEQTLFDFPELANLFNSKDTIDCCNLLFELGRDKQVIAILDACLNSKGASASALLLKGKALRRQKQTSQAINCARNAEILEPDNTDILRFLTECYAQQNRFEEELEYLQRLAELLPDDRTLQRLIPITLNKLNRHEEALAQLFKLDYETAEDNEDRSTIITLIADTALSLRKLDIAERYSEKELERKGRNPWTAHMRLGHIKLLQNNLKGSIVHYEQYVNTYCQEQKKDMKAALAMLNEQWAKQHISPSAHPDDLLLIHDILQATSEGSL